MSRFPPNPLDFVTNSEQIQLHWPDVLVSHIQPAYGFLERAVRSEPLLGFNTAGFIIYPGT